MWSFIFSQRNITFNLEDQTYRQIIFKSPLLKEAKKLYIFRDQKNSSLSPVYCMG